MSASILYPEEAILMRLRNPAALPLDLDNVPEAARKLEDALLQKRGILNNKRRLDE